MSWLFAPVISKYKQLFVNAILFLLVTVAVANTKQYSEIEYLEDIPFDTNYDIDTVYTGTGQMSYTLDEIYDGKEINDNDEPSFLLHLDNDAVVDKVLFNNSNDNVSEIMQNNDIDIDKAGSDLDLVPNESYLLDNKPVENYSIDILSDILVGNDLEPGEVRVIDKIDKHYLIDAHHDVIVDKKKVIIKSKGKLNAKDNNLVKTMLNIEAGPVGNDDNTQEDVTHLVDTVGDEKDDSSKGNMKRKCVARNTEDNIAEGVDKSNTKDLIKNKKKVNKRVVKVKKDGISLLAQICTELQNPDVNTVNTVKVNDSKVDDPKAKDESQSLTDTHVDDTSASKESKSKKRGKKNAGKKEASVKENVSGNVEDVKAKKPRKEKKRKYCSWNILYTTSFDYCWQ